MTTRSAPQQPGAPGRLATAGQRLAPLAILLFVGGWLPALGLRRPQPD